MSERQEKTPVSTYIQAGAVVAALLVCVGIVLYSAGASGAVPIGMVVILAVFGLLVWRAARRR